MVHTAPDYADTNKLSTIFGELDNGELAARLNSIDTFDRRGSIVCIDDFEEGISKWKQTATGAQSTAFASIDLSRNGDTCCKLTCGPGVLDNMRIDRLMPLPVLGPLGFEVSFSIDTNTNTFLIYFLIYDGTNLYNPIIEIDKTNTQIEYLDDANAMQILDASLNLNYDKYLFHTIKLVCDYSTSNYVRLIIDDTTYDMSTLGMYTVLNATAPHILASIRHYGRAANTDIVYVDDVILTQNEPL